MAEQTPDEISQAFSDFLKDEVQISWKEYQAIQYNQTNFDFRMTITITPASSLTSSTANNAD